MADIGQLNGLLPSEPLDLDAYQDNQEMPPLPKAGRYTVKAPETFPTTAFGVSKAGALTAEVSPTIVGPTNEGYTIRYAKVSAKQFKRSGMTVSQLGDYLRACGFRGKFTDPQEQADAVETTANRVYQVDVDWRAYKKGTQFAVEGMDKFPSDGNGGHQPWYPDPTDKDENGNPLKLRAGLIVTRYVPATE